jgi:hypothetical protein
MNEWYRVSLSPGASLELQNSFADLFAAAAAPKGAAMFKSRNGAEHYFSPAAMAFALPLIKSWDGEPCPTPAKSEIYLLIGHQHDETIPLA